MAAVDQNIKITLLNYHDAKWCQRTNTVIYHKVIANWTRTNLYNSHNIVTCNKVLNYFISSPESGNRDGTYLNLFSNVFDPVSLKSMTSSNVEIFPFIIFLRRRPIREFPPTAPTERRPQVRGFGLETRESLKKVPSKRAEMTK